MKGEIDNTALVKSQTEIECTKLYPIRKRAIFYPLSRAKTEEEINSNYMFRSTYSPEKHTTFGSVATVAYLLLLVQQFGYNDLSHQIKIPQLSFIYLI